MAAEDVVYVLWCAVVNAHEQEGEKAGGRQVGKGGRRTPGTKRIREGTGGTAGAGRRAKKTGGQGGGGGGQRRQKRRKW